jgi:hypothetical protein
LRRSDYRIKETLSEPTSAVGGAPDAFSGTYRSTDAIHPAAKSWPILGTGPGLAVCADRFPAFFNTLGYTPTNRRRERAANV